MTNAVRQIACSQCGAPLELHGGHRTRSLSCGYCGALMDTQQDYQVVKRYKDTPRPDTPLKIGLQGTFKGVEFTIIGLVEYVSDDNYYWVDFQLYSPTHGYVWLTYDDGHYVFSRRVRELPKPAVFGAFYYKKTVKAMGKTFRACEKYRAKITYVEGELTWIAKRGDMIRAADAIAPPYIFSYETNSDKELEYNFGEYIPAKTVHQTFNIDPPTHKPEEIHPAQPYIPNPLLNSGFVAAKYYLMLLPIMLMAVIFFGSGSEILKQIFDFSQQKVATSQDFHIDNPKRLLELRLSAALYNSRTEYTVNIYDKTTGKSVYNASRGLAYYTGRYNDGESWSDGSKNAKIRLKLPQAGDYYIKLRASGELNKTPQVTLSIRNGVMAGRYFVYLMLFMLVILLLLPLRRYTFEQKRWQAIGAD